jgi:hypothetical protein
VKKALLITYFFPPVNAVAGLRAWSWAKNFHKNNLELTVVTRHWQGDEIKWSQLTEDTDLEITFDKNNNYSIYKLPSKKVKLIALLKNNLLKLRIFSKAFFFIVNAFGFFNTEADARASFKKFLVKHLTEKKYDLIIVTSPPLNLIRLAYDLNKLFHIPFHVDFRDLWNNGYLNKKYKPSFSLTVIDWFKRIYIKKWLTRAGSVSAVSGPIAAYLMGIYKKEPIVITNGFESDAFIDIHKRDSAQFRFSLVGSYYPQQELEIFIEGMNRFILEAAPSDFVINLIGISVHDTVFVKLSASLPPQLLNIRDRVSTAESIDYVINSEVLFLAAWKGYRGIYTTKIFDFIASRNNVLIAPGDDDVIDELINRTSAGKIVNSVEEFVAVMKDWYNEWKEKGTLSYSGKQWEIEKYSRSTLAAHLAEKLKEMY